VPARDTRTGPPHDSRGPAAGDRPAVRRTATARRGDRSVGTGREGRPGSQGSGVGEGLVIGTVPPAVRITGILLLLAALLGAVAAFPTYLEVGGRSLTQADSVGGALLALLVPGVTAAMGLLLLRRVLPKLGLAYAAVAGALAIGQLLIELYRSQSSVDRPGVEVLAGDLVLTSGVDIGPGWVLGVAGLALTVVAGGLAVATWSRTVMDDGGALDAVRAPLAGASVLLGVGAVLCLILPAADVQDDLVLDPLTGLQVVVTREGPQGLLERPGLALLGGLLLAGALVLCSVIAPSLRPRLAAVGAFLALTVTVLSAGLSGLRDAVSSDDLDWTLPGAGLLVVGLGFAALTLLAWRLRRRT
jgi:hypothetical protein